MDGQNWRNIKGAAEEIPIVTYYYLIEIPNTGTDKLIILDVGDTLRTCIASGMNLVLDTNTGPSYESYVICRSLMQAQNVRLGSEDL
jgi:hypothetical protein